MNKKQPWVKSYFLIGQKAIVIDGSGNILLLRRSSETPRPGGWDFIGGGLGKGEDAIKGIKREIREETGISITDVKPITITTHKEGKDGVVLIFYIAKVKSEKVKLSWEHDDYKWLSKNEIMRMKIPARMKKIIKEYI